MVPRTKHTYACVNVQTALHLAAASLSGATSLEILLSEGADVSAKVCAQSIFHTEAISLTSGLATEP